MRLTSLIRLGHEIALDAGTGTGPFAMALAPLVREVIGVDPVPEMLDRARRLASAVPNVRFVEGSVYELPVDDASIESQRSYALFTISIGLAMRFANLPAFSPQGAVLS